MIKIDELINSNTPYSTTRWAFVVCVKAAIVLAIATLISYVVLTVLGKDCNGLLGGSSILIGVIVGIPTGAKALQGFENKSTDEINDKKEIIEPEK